MNGTKEVSMRLTTRERVVYSKETLTALETVIGEFLEAKGIHTEAVEFSDEDGEIMDGAFSVI